MKKIFYIIVALFGLMSELSACYRGYVYGLNRYGDNFLAVRRGPDTSYRRIDVLHNGDKVYICDRAGRWKKIFYGYDCFLKDGYPIGKCYSGWAYGKYID
jgi:hypothetical protein